MAQIFISHSSRDEAQAMRLIDWLRGRRFSNVFLDFDKHGGIPPGADWERRLYREVADCEAVILILTVNWFDSKWCFVEFAQARALGKPIFPVIETPMGELLVSPDIQHLDLVRDRDGGLERLAAELTLIAVNARGGFPWDRTRPPFPGLLAFGEADAAIYFGRDDDIRRLIERLNARRAQGGANLVALLGASGSGKSSLLRAGVLPRLKRDQGNWIVLPPFRPRLHPLDELAQAFAAGLGDASDWRRWRDVLDPDKGDGWRTRLMDLARDLRARHGANEAQILLAIDQGEELFGAAEPQQAARFLRMLDAVLGDELPFMAVLALRSDYLDRLQQAGLAARFEEFSLKPMPLERVRDIVEGPAKVAGLAVEEGLAAAAIKDAATDDALPLLAFALRELYDHSAATGRLSLDGYRALGDDKAGVSPLENAVRRRADEILAEAAPTTYELAGLKEAFVPAMVRVNAGGDYVRRPARVDALPEPARRLIERLRDARLLVQRREGASATIEVAHEALLRKWPVLRGWLDEEREFLVGKDQLEKDLAEWEKAPPHQKGEALLSGLKLGRARLWLAVKPRQLVEAERRYITASADAQDAAMTRRERLRRRILMATAAGLVVALALASLTGWQWHTAETQRREAETERAAAQHSLELATETANGLVFDLAQKFRNVVGMPVATVKDVLERARQLQNQLLASGQTSQELRRSEGAALDEAADTLLALGETPGAIAAATMARDLFVTLLKGQPDNTDWLGALSVSYDKVGDGEEAQGRVVDALQSYQAGLAIRDHLAKSDPRNNTWQHDLSVSYEKVGDVQVSLGHLPDAAQSYKASLEIMDRLTSSNPGNAGWQRDLSVSHEKVGDVQIAQGHVLEGLRSYEADLSIRLNLVEANPRHTDWQHDLSVSYEKVGDVQVSLGHLPDAAQSYKASLEIMDRLTSSDPGNAGWQRDLSVAHEKVGDVQVAQGRLGDALQSYRMELSIIGHLATSDSGNAVWQHDLAEAYSKIGSVEAQGHLSDAEESYQESLRIRNRLASSDPRNAGWQRDLSVSYDRVGNVQLARGQLRLALQSYQNSRVIRDRLARADAGNFSWQSDKSISSEKIGDVQAAQGHLSEALRSYEEGLAIRHRLANEDPANTRWQRSLVVSYNKIGDIQLAQGHLTEGLRSYMSGLAIAKRLASSDPDNAGWQRDLSVSLERVGNTQLAQNQLVEALQSYQANLKIRNRLTGSDPGNLSWQRDLSVAYAKLAVAFEKAGQVVKEREAVLAGRAIIIRLISQNPNWDEWKQDLAWFDAQIATLPK